MQLDCIAHYEEKNVCCLDRLFIIYLLQQKITFFIDDQSKDAWSSYHDDKVGRVDIVYSRAEQVELTLLKVGARRV